MKYAKAILYSAVLCGLITADARSRQYTGNDLFYGTPSSIFINRWSFQEFCDHVYDPRTGRYDQATTRKKGGISFNPQKVVAGDIIFVRRIDLFMKKMHPLINAPYIMLTHGDYLDTTLEESLAYLDDPKIIAWFSVHPPQQAHPKYYPIPLGVAQRREIYAQKERYMTLIEALRKAPKRRLLSGAFSLDFNDDRVALSKMFEGKSYYYSAPADLPFDDYLEELAASLFTLSPRGWGPDCYRTWEALLVGTIPIVRRGEYGVLDCVRHNVINALSPCCRANCSQLDRLYENLPIVVVDEWKQVTPKFLCKKYKQISSQKYDIELLHINYWKEKIKTVKEEYLQTHN